MNAYCTNRACPELDQPKAAGHLEPLPTVIHCGHCGKPCELRQPEATPAAGA